MNFISIDIETLGLGIDAPVIEVGAVMVIDNEIQDSRFHCYCPPRTGAWDNCEPYAMFMHAKTGILERIAKKVHPHNYVTPPFVWREFVKWANAFDVQWPKNKFVVAGKNVAAFDLPRLETHCDFKLDRFHHRTIDPGCMWMNSEDDVPPSLDECCRRAGYNVVVPHKAVDDACITAKVILARFE